MSSQLWDDVASYIEESRPPTTPGRGPRRVLGEAEVFTPTALVIEILQYVDLSLLGPGRTVIDPACGDGQFLVAAKAVKIIHHGMTPDEALKDLFGVDIVRANVEACRERLGGGTIVLGDSLRPESRIAGQTATDRRLLQQLLAPTTMDVSSRRSDKTSGANEARLTLF